MIDKSDSVKSEIHKRIPINCGNIIIRRYDTKDSRLYYKYTKDPAVSRYLECNPTTKLKFINAFIKAVIQRYTTEKITRFAIVSADSNALIGSISMYVSTKGDKIELGYWLGRPHWGNGYMEIVLKHAIQAICEINYVTKILIRVDKRNIASIKTAEKVGLRFTGKYAENTEEKQVMFMEMCINR